MGNEVTATEPNETSPGAGTAASKPAGKMTQEELAAVINGSDLEPEETNEPESDADPEKETPAEEGEKKEKEGSDKPSEIEELRAEVERLRKKTENQDKFFDRVGTEVGLLRKRTPEEEKAKLEEIKLVYIEDPVEGHKMMEAYLDEEASSKEAHAEQAAQQKIIENRDIILRVIPDFEDGNGKINQTVIDEMAKLMIEDGAAEKKAEAFKAYPYLMEPSALYNLHKRNTLFKEAAELKRLVEEKDKEISELKKKPGQILDKIEQSSKVRTMTNRSDGGNNQAQSTESKDIRHRSKEELDKIINGG